MAAHNARLSSSSIRLHCVISCSVRKHPWQRPLASSMRQYEMHGDGTSCAVPRAAAAACAIDFIVPAITPCLPPAHRSGLQGFADAGAPPHVDDPRRPRCPQSETARDRSRQALGWHARTATLFALCELGDQRLCPPQTIVRGPPEHCVWALGCGWANRLVPHAMDISRVARIGFNCRAPEASAVNAGSRANKIFVGTKSAAMRLNRLTEGRRADRRHGRREGNLRDRQGASPCRPGAPGQRPVRRPDQPAKSLRCRPRRAARAELQCSP